MEILEFEKAVTREGFDNYYFIILNNREKKYNCSIVINNKQIIRRNCDCMWHTMAISKNKPIIKYCRYFTFSIEYLKKEDITL